LKEYEKKALAKLRAKVEEAIMGIICSREERASKCKIIRREQREREKRRRE
jgi:hypothetical protein